MDTSLVGLAVADPAEHADWARLIAGAGCRPYGLDLEQLPPRALKLRTLVVALDLRHPPIPYGFWLRRVATPILLITPHVDAAQTLCPQVLRLAAIVDPFQAARHLGDLLKMVAGITGGTLILPAVPTAAAPRWWQGVVA